MLGKKRTLFLKICLYISSYIPLYFLITLKEIIDILTGNLSFDVVNAVMIIFNLGLILLGLISVFVFINQSDYENIEILSCHNITKDDFLPYFPLFVLFALAFELEYLSMAVVYVIILIMVGVVYIKNEMFHINPFLNMIGYRTYKVTYKLKDKIFEDKNLLSLRSVEKGYGATNGFILK